LIGGHGVSIATRFSSLEQVIVLNDEVVEELDAQIALRLNIVLHVNKAVDFDVNGEAVGGELRRYFFVDLDEHVVRALHDTLLRLLLAHTVRQAQLVERDLGDEVIDSAAV